MKFSIGTLFAPSETRLVVAFQELIVSARDTLVSLAGDIAAKVTPVVDDLIAVMQGRDKDVKNNIILVIRDGIVQFADKNPHAVVTTRGFAQIAGHLLERYNVLCARRDYPDAGYQLIPLHHHAATSARRGKKREMGKAPRDKAWTKPDCNSARVLAAAIKEICNVGVGLKADQLVIDVEARIRMEHELFRLALADRGVPVPDPHDL